MITIPYHYSQMMKWFWNNYPSMFQRFLDSIHHNQLEGKKWLVDSLDNVQIPRDKDGKFKVEVIGGWFGFPLIDLLLSKYGDDVKHIDFYEPDKFCCKIFANYCHLYFDEVEVLPAEFLRVRKGDNWIMIHIFNMNYFNATVHRRVHLVINPSSEHMPSMTTMRQYYELPERTLLALQSNDKDDEPDHMNCVKSSQELAQQAGIRELFGGTMKLITRDKDNRKQHFNRFMVFGKW